MGPIGPGAPAVPAAPAGPGGPGGPAGPGVPGAPMAAGLFRSSFLNSANCSEWTKKKKLATCDKTVLSWVKYELRYELHLLQQLSTFPEASRHSLLGPVNS